MTCDRFIAPIDAYVDGTLEPAGAAALEAHLTECAACREDVVALQEILQSTAALERSRQPARDLWSGIEDRLLEDPVPLSIRRRARGLPRWSLAAAVALVVLSSAGTALLIRSPGRTELSPVIPSFASTLPGDLAATEEDFFHAAAELAAALQERGDLAEAVRERLRHLVAVVDDAIDESRTVVSAFPDDATAKSLLWTAHRQKIELLEQVARLARERGT